MDLNLIMNGACHRVGKKPAPIRVEPWGNGKASLGRAEEQTCHHPTPAASPTAESTARMPSQEPWQPSTPAHHSPDVHLPPVEASPVVTQQLPPTPVIPQEGGGSPVLAQKPQMIPVISSIEVKGVVIDTKTRRFVCQVCRKEFIRKSGLVRHNLIHLGVRPNKCNICNKQFLQKSALTVHYRIHSGEKPYACRHCGRRFGDSSSLCRHYRMHVAKGEGGK